MSLKHFSSIKLEDNFFQYKTENGKSDWLKNLKKINIFVAPNNSGKSRLLRYLFKKYPYSYIPSYDVKSIEKKVRETAEEAKSWFINHNVQHKTFNSLLPLCEVELSSLNENELKVLLSNLDKEIDNAQKTPARTNNITFQEMALGINTIFKPLFQDPKINRYLKLSSQKKERVYVPHLRGLKRHDDSPNDYYRHIIETAYFSDTNEVPGEIVTGQRFYQEFRSHLLGEKKQRESIRSFEHFISKSFFDNSSVTIIPRENENILTVRIGTEKEQPIHHLGDGLQNIIITSFPLFMKKGQECLFFIEEPEMWLHPGFQRKLLEILSTGEGFENFQFFITTHSNHLLDISLDFSKDISIYIVSKEYKDDSDEREPISVIENKASGDQDLLLSLGVRNSSVFLANATIWVEGITDRYYLKKYIELFLKEYPELKRIEEDIDYVFVEYGGNNITHWFELTESEIINVERLCSKLFLIADKDGANKSKRHKKLKDILRNRFSPLTVREIENLISKEVLLKVLESYGEDITTMNRSFKEKDYNEELLGRFIENVILSGKNKRKYASDSGTIHNKKDFCDRVIKHTISWNDLRIQAKTLTEQVYRFVVSQKG